MSWAGAVCATNRVVSGWKLQILGIMENQLNEFEIIALNRCVAVKKEAAAVDDKRNIKRANGWMAECHRLHGDGSEILRYEVVREQPEIL